MNFSVLVCLLIFITICSFAQPGTLDTDFDEDGMLTTSIGGSSGVADAIAIQPDGKIVVAGFSYVKNNDFALVRYNIDGTLDNSFSEDGTVTTDFGYYDYIYSIALQSDGKIVAAGTSYNGTNWVFALARYNTDGELDTTFSEDGKVRTAIGTEKDLAYSVAIQPDGKILLAGNSKNGTYTDFAIVRYNVDGKLDSTFNSDGIVTTDFENFSDGARSVAIQKDGKILAAGHASNWAGQGELGMVRYNSDGTLDNSFGEAGKVSIRGGSATSLAIQSDCKIVVAGLDFSITRYNIDGTLDNTFGLDGKVITDIAGSIEYCYSMAIQPDGKIIAVGTSLVDTNWNFALVRYNTDGTLDDNFSTDGKVTTNFGSEGSSANSVAIQPDGKIVVAGFISITNMKWNFAVARYISGLNIEAADSSLATDSIMIYPNPIGKDAILEYSFTNDEIQIIELYDISGRIISSIPTDEIISECEQKVALNFNESLPPGIYILRITNTSQSFSIKIVKQ
ncbi:MAG: T9SS type A sorting domain-containing protein [Bacteroidetes bacterium]|nr:T9SS type A sorting domain-containing protein [Bacteroidota bacterium]